MSQKNVKAARRQARKVGREFGQALAEGMIQPRPRWCPVWLWGRLLRLVLKPR